MYSLSKGEQDKTTGKFAVSLKNYFKEEPN